MEYKHVMTTFYDTLHKPHKSITRQTYDIWREKVGQTIKKYIEKNKLADIRRYIMRNNRLTDAEVIEIK